MAAVWYLGACLQAVISLWEDLFLQTFFCSTVYWIGIVIDLWDELNWTGVQLSDGQVWE